MTHHTEVPLAAAQLCELEDMHEELVAILDEVTARLSLVNDQLSLCVQALEALVVSQG